MVLPVILGMDVNAYGMARMFHMEYGIKSLLVGQGKLWMTDNSSICDIKLIKNIFDDEIFVNSMRDLAEELLKKYDNLILIASSDAYAEICIKHKDELRVFYFMPFAGKELLSKLVNKKDFYETCEKYSLPYPKTVVIDKTNYRQATNPFGYPSVLKASSSIDYFPLNFEGKKKAYILKDEEEFKNTLKTIYETTDYDKEMILQEFILGDDSKMFVLNAYVNKSGKVTAMSLGHVVMEDPTPELIGNYLAIIPGDGEKVYPVFKNFLESIHYTGFANFDMKYDIREDKYNVFEINLRQGRSSFFSPLSGVNLAKAVYNDVEGLSEDIKYPDKEFLWLGARLDTIIHYVKDEKMKSEMLRLDKDGKSAMTLDYDKDNGFMRKRAFNKYYDSYSERFKKFFEEK